MKTQYTDGDKVIVHASALPFKGGSTKWHRTGTIIGRSNVNRTMWRIEFLNGSVATVNEDSFRRTK